jgi:hypothetical protein
MATLRLPSFPEVMNLFKKDNPQSDSGARQVVREAYEQAGGPTTGLKRVYESFLENERRREATKG